MNRVLQRDSFFALFLAVCFWLLVSQNVPAIVDVNGNTMSDIWEEDYHNQTLFPDTADYLPTADPDGDGWTNALEAAAGTNPFEANPPDGIVRPELAPETTPGAYTLVWPSLPGKVYQLQCSDSLDSDTWIAVGAPLLGDGDPIIKILDCQPSNGTLPPKLFWRVAISDTDADNDGLTNAEEAQLGTDPTLSDSDGDGLNDKQEIELGTNPNNPDTDGDGSPDGDEVEKGHDPKSNQSYPPRWVHTQRRSFHGLSYIQSSCDWSSNAPSRYWDPTTSAPETCAGFLATDCPFPAQPPDNNSHFTYDGGYAPYLVESPGSRPDPGHSTQLSQSRFWLKTKPARDFDRKIKVLRVTRRKILGANYSETNLPLEIEPLDVLIRANQIFSDPLDALTTFTQTLQTGEVESVVKSIVPVQVDDNKIATGVDNVSIRASTSDIGYQEKFWIMAPSGDAPPAGNPPTVSPCSNDVIYKLPLETPMQLEATCTHASQTVGTVTLAQNGASCSWHGNSTTTTESPSVTWKLGLAGPPVGPKQSMELPIGVKTMKRRTVKVAVYPVTQHPIGGTFSPPDITAFTNKLNEVFAYQTNAWFELHYQPLVRLPLYLNGNTYLYPDSVEENDLHTNIRNRNDSNEDYDIVLILINDVNFQDPPIPIPGGFKIDAVKGHMLSSRAAVVCSGYHDLEVEPITPETVMDTAAHEIGHVILGEFAHPDDNEGRAPLKGTDRTCRLMCSGPNRSPGAKLLVKKEWDKIEDWLSENPDIRENRNN